MSLTPVIRFFAHVDTTAGARKCWPWLGAKSEHGYGIFRYDGRAHRATHFALRIDGRPLQEGQYACHHCDNPVCVNPDHLFGGTQAENVADMKAKDRQMLGERNPATKLTSEDVRQIRTARAQGGSLQEISDHFGVSTSTVQRIVKRQVWAHVPPAESELGSAA